VAGIANHFAKDLGEVAAAWHEVHDFVARLKSGERDDLFGLAIYVSLTICVWSAGICNRRGNIVGYRGVGIVCQRREGEGGATQTDPLNCSRHNTYYTRHSRVGGNPVEDAAARQIQNWIPAYAGMTMVS
jgi:hypothetical protein